MHDNKSEAFFVICIQIKSKNVFEIVNSLQKYFNNFFLELSSMHVYVNSFVLSYFIKIDKEKKTRNYFIRTNRKEIEDLKSKYLNPKDFLDNVENKLIDELFRNLQQLLVTATTDLCIWLN